VVFKRTGASPGPISKTEFFTPLVAERLNSIRTCPTTFQEYIEGRCDLRVIWIAGDIYATAGDSQSGTTPQDCRFDHTVAYLQWKLPKSVTEGLSRLMTGLGLLYGAIDLRLGDDNDYYFLEVNPAGQFIYVELKTGYPLISAVASLLANPSET
jgi:glutathione synthase/RimK-type ligase-like ATP-grasp enzyme